MWSAVVGRPASQLLTRPATCPLARPLTPPVEATGFDDEEQGRRRLLPPKPGKIPIHIEPTQHPFKGIDHSVTIFIQFLEVIVQQVADLRIRRPNAGTMALTRIIPLRLAEHAKIREVRLGLKRRAHRRFLR